MGFLTFGKPSLKMVFFIIMPVFYTIRAISFTHLGKTEIPRFPFLLSFFMFVTEAICGLLELILCNNSKVEPSKAKTKKSTFYGSSVVPLNYQLEEHLKKDTKCYIWIFLCTLIDFTCYTIITYLCIDIQNSNFQTEMRIAPTLFIIFLSHFILGSQIYNHHIFAIFLISIGFIAISVYRIIKLEFLLKFSIFFFCHFFYSIKQIQDKYLMEKYFISPYFLLFLEGVIGMGYSAISLIVSQFIPCGENNDFCFGNETFDSFLNIKCIVEKINDKDVYVGLLLFILGSIGLNLFLMLIKKHYSPVHRSISDSFAAFICWVTLFFYTKEQNIPTIELLIMIFSFTLIIIGNLVFNEFIIINAFGLDENTKEEIIKRSERKENISLGINTIENINNSNNNIDEDVGKHFKMNENLLQL